ncbi:haloacid dehalogenase [Thalassobacillus devorans]|uniref:Haloacid dehalogenase n=1 Tax=Thalassobacillus devorans TaxID=279813 RepID=A0ABQ1NQ98_9BACI|nr:haloacid dehalogenase type II [Thalassobacillus devorans]NIK28898.1 2-haloacid dehalogenase [Thalassobacillus devorans]GGC82758.1 haloacid dehalogenase [Thalassobacillus devorans]
MFKAYLFDAYGTLFDVHSVTEKLEEVYPEKGHDVSQEWRKRQVHYFMIRQLIDSYQPFDQITRHSLIDALEFNQAEYDTGRLEELMEAYRHLKPFEEVKRLTTNLPDHRLTIFSNGTNDMLLPLLKNNQLDQTFSILSADEPKIYKPDPKAYAFAHRQLEIADPKEILFLSSNPWDIAGAKNYGFSTAWVNRSQQKWPSLGIQPDFIYQDLNELP